jgi:hypothetical protein
MDKGKENLTQETAAQISTLVETTKPITPPAQVSNVRLADNHPLRKLSSPLTVAYNLIDPNDQEEKAEVDALFVLSQRNFSLDELLSVDTSEALKKSLAKILYFHIEHNTPPATMSNFFNSMQNYYKNKKTYKKLFPFFMKLDTEGNAQILDVVPKLYDHIKQVVQTIHDDIQVGQHLTVSELVSEGRKFLGIIGRLERITGVQEHIPLFYKFENFVESIPDNGKIPPSEADNFLVKFDGLKKELKNWNDSLLETLGQLTEEDKLAILYLHRYQLLDVDITKLCDIQNDHLVMKRLPTETVEGREKYADVVRTVPQIAFNQWVRSLNWNNANSRSEVWKLMIQNDGSLFDFEKQPILTHRLLQNPQYFAELILYVSDPKNLENVSAQSQGNIQKQLKFLWDKLPEQDQKNALRKQRLRDEEDALREAQLEAELEALQKQPEGNSLRKRQLKEELDALRKQPLKNQPETPLFVLVLNHAKTQLVSGSSDIVLPDFIQDSFQQWIRSWLGTRGRKDELVPVFDTLIKIPFLLGTLGIRESLIDNLRINSDYLAEFIMYLSREDISGDKSNALGLCSDVWNTLTDKNKLVALKIIDEDLEKLVKDCQNNHRFLPHFQLPDFIIKNLPKSVQSMSKKIGRNLSLIRTGNPPVRKRRQPQSSTSILSSLPVTSISRPPVVPGMVSEEEGVASGVSTSSPESLLKPVSTLSAETETSSTINNWRTSDKVVVTKFSLAFALSGHRKKQQAQRRQNLPEKAKGKTQEHYQYERVDWNLKQKPLHSETIYEDENVKINYTNLPSSVKQRTQESKVNCPGNLRISLSGKDHDQYQYALMAAINWKNNNEINSENPVYVSGKASEVLQEAFQLLNVDPKFIVVESGPTINPIDLNHLTERQQSLKEMNDAIKNQVELSAISDMTATATPRQQLEK